jgi:hypothetical protein
VLIALLSAVNSESLNPNPKPQTPNPKPQTPIITLVELLNYKLVTPNLKIN